MKSTKQGAFVTEIVREAMDANGADAGQDDGWSARAVAIRFIPLAAPNAA